MQPQQRQERIIARDERLNRAQRDFEKQGWNRVGEDHWRRHTNESATSLHLDPAAEQRRTWRVTVETGGEVMALSFRSRSFGAAVSEANRCYNLAHASEEQREINRQRQLDEHYGRERMDGSEYP